jgi:TatD DNase family protein
MLCVCVDMESFPQVLVLARTHANVSASVGVHPHHTGSHIGGHEPTAEELARWAKDPSVVAIGETGLDYYRSPDDAGWQRERFRRHIAAARLCGKPLIVHSREAKEDTVRILHEEGAEGVGGVMHCFTEDWEMAEQAMGMGFYISFSGIVTFKSASALKAIAQRVPLSRMLIETDSPYLAPVPHRGKSNQPAYVYHVAKHIAELRGEPLEHIAMATTRNYFNLFQSS